MLQFILVMAGCTGAPPPTPPVPASQYAYDLDNGYFAETCTTWSTKEGTRSLDDPKDAGTIVDCGGDLDLSVEGVLLVQGETSPQFVVDHPLTQEEFVAAAQVVAAKNDPSYVSTGHGLDAWCEMLCDALLNPATRNADCPEVKGSYVAQTNTTLTDAMNEIDGGTGTWCHQTVDFVDSLNKQARQIWWAVPFSMHNFSGGAILYDPDQGETGATWGMAFSVAGQADQQFKKYLTKDGVAQYPAASTLSLANLKVSYSQAGTGAQSTGFPAWASNLAGSTVMDPDDVGEFLAEDAFIGAQTAAAVWDPVAPCPTSTGFEGEEVTDPLEGVGQDESCME